jgi:hypothetical protein
MDNLAAAAIIGLWMLVAANQIGEGLLEVAKAIRELSDLEVSIGEIDEKGGE